MTEKPKRVGTGHRERLRDRFRQGSPDSHTEAALLDLLLTYATPQKDVRALAEELLARFGDLSAVLAADASTLSAQKGIGEQTATMLKLVHWIGVHQLASPAGQFEGAVPEDVLQLHEQSAVHDEDRPSVERSAAIRTATPYPKTREPGLFSGWAAQEERRCVAHGHGDRWEALIHVHRSGNWRCSRPAVAARLPQHGCHEPVPATRAAAIQMMSVPGY